MIRDRDKIIEELESILRDINATLAKPTPTNVIPFRPRTPPPVKIDACLFDLTCPYCGVSEVDENDQLNIRGFKVERDGYWFSFCLCCKRWF